MCLEDQFLETLIYKSGSVEVNDVADSLGISINALLSIINRVEANLPHFIYFEKDNQNISKVYLIQDKVEATVSFLNSGGFTAINEKEFNEFAEERFIFDKVKEQVKEVIKKLSWRRWATGIAVTFGTGLTLMMGLKHIKKRL